MVVPEGDVSVICRGKQLAVGREGYAFISRFLGFLQTPPQFSCFKIKQVDRGTVQCSKTLIVWRDGYVIDPDPTGSVDRVV